MVPIVSLLLVGSTTAAELKEAPVTQIVKDVHLLSGQATVANYQGFGGTGGVGTGTFSGQGAIRLPQSQAPAIGNPGQGP